MPEEPTGNHKPCPFCKIVEGATEADVVLRQGDVLALLDHRPLVEGHVLVVPTRHVQTMMDLPDAQVGPLFVVAKRMARALDAALEAPGALIMVNNRVSQSVHHLHVHVIPRRFQDGLFSKPFFWSRRKPASAEARAAMLLRLRAALAEEAASSL